MPARVDHDARRRDVAAAVWRVLTTTGFAGLGMRAVAAEMGATTGLITHYFPSKRDLVCHALDLLHEQTDRGHHVDPDLEGLDGLRTRLRSVLPTTEEMAQLSRIWVGFWDVALVDPELSAREAARYDRWRGVLRPLVDQAMAAGDLRRQDTELVLDMLTTTTHGLVVQALFDSARFPRKRQHALVDALLDSLG